MRVALGADHGGWPIRRAVIAEVARLGHTLIDLGADRLDADDDYPDYAAAQARELVAAFLNARFAAEVPRYVRRVNKVRAIEQERRD